MYKFRDTLIDTSKVIKIFIIFVFKTLILSSAYKVAALLIASSSVPTR
jgi:hypothetical protein